MLLSVYVFIIYILKEFYHDLIVLASILSFHHIIFHFLSIKRVG